MGLAPLPGETFTAVGAHALDAAVTECVAEARKLVSDSEITQRALEEFNLVPPMELTN